jgi:hypothetical protein
MAMPIRAKRIEEMMGIEHIIEGDWRFCLQPLHVPFRPISGQLGLLFGSGRIGSYNCNAKWMSACLTGYAYNQHTWLLTKKLNAFGGKVTVTITAILLLEVFLDGLETSALKFAHDRPSILGSE